MTVAAVASLTSIPCWHFVLFAADALGWSALRGYTARFGTGAVFVIGLGWVVWYVERVSQRYEAVRRARAAGSTADPVGALAFETGSVSAFGAPEQKIWNPLDPDAWYYGRRQKRLNQSVLTFVGYTLAFVLVFLLLTQIGGCSEIYELPAGGGEQAQLRQTVRIQKVIRKKYVLNPFSSIKFRVPPIEEIKLQLEEITRHAYTVGYGQGSGAGFAGGTNKGKVRLIRLEYDGGDWDLNMGVGRDLNMLNEYGIRTSHKVADRTEARRISQLRAFPRGKSPPLVFMTGTRAVSTSKTDERTLREYLLDKHGMLFASAGSSTFDSQFKALMNRVLPEVRPVPIPLDDKIHRVPYPIPFFPYAAPHGEKLAWGWKVDGRWVCYYHPGDISDAWADDHAGIRPEVWEACYQLGTNVIFYAHSEYSKWLAAQQTGD